MCTDVAARYVRMEVEYDTLTECKEGGDGAYLQVHESDNGSSSDFSMQIDDGQFVQMSACPSMRIYSTDAPLCAPCWCAGAVTIHGDTRT